MKQIFALIICLSALKSYSQKHGEALIDSLKKEIPITKTDSTKIRLYLRISDVYIDIDLNKAMAFADSGAVLAQKIKWEDGIASSQLNYGNVYNFMGEHNKAAENVQQAYLFYLKKGDKKSIGTAVYTLGVSNERLGNYAVAAEKYFEALHIFEKLPGADRLTGNSLSAIAVIYFLQRDYTKSLDYSFKALAKQEAAKNIMGIANEYVAIADTYNELHDSANAIRYNLQALEMEKKMDSKFGEAVIYFQLGKLYHNNYGLALDYHLKAEKLFTQLNDNSNFASFNRGEIGRIFFAIAKQTGIVTMLPSSLQIPNDKNTLLQLAEKYLQTSVTVSRETGDKDNESSLSASLAELQAYKGDYKNAYLNFRVFHKTQDSIYSQQNKNRIATLESQKEIDLKNKTIENKELELSNQQKKVWLLVTGIAFLIITGSLFYYQSRSRKKTNTALLQLNSELDEANKVKAKFFGILSHDLRSPVANLINFLQLQKRNPGILSEQDIDEREKKISNSASSLLETMEGMLLWSKGQMEQFKPEVTTVPASKLFSYLQKNFADTPNVTFNFINDSDVYMNTDPDYLQTIMQNLTANAIKALHQTSAAQITWKAWQQNSTIYLSITDNGPGISNEQAKSLFDETHITGTRHGLGLHIIRDLAKAISCSINIATDSRQGTTFVLAL